MGWYFFALALLLISFGWNVLFGFSCVKEKKKVDFLCAERNFKRRMKLLVQLFPFLCKVPSVRIFRSLFKLSLLGKCVIRGSFYTSLVCIEILTDADIHYYSDFVVYFRMWSLCFCCFVVSLIRILCSLLWTFIHKNIWIFFFHLPQNNI